MKNKGSGDKQEDFSKFSVDELKSKLKEAGLPVSGKKALLIERLESNKKTQFEIFIKDWVYTKGSICFSLIIYYTIIFYLVIDFFAPGCPYVGMTDCDTFYSDYDNGSTTNDVFEADLGHYSFLTLFFGTGILISILVSFLPAWAEEFSSRTSTPSKGNSFTLFYIASFLIPIAGFIIGAIFLVSGDNNTKEAGQTCVGIGIASIIIGMALFVAVAFLFV